jgi:predicted transcriptional regulator
MNNAKDTVRSLLDRMPDDCSMDDVLYQLYVVQQIELGRADADAGRLISHDEVARRLRDKWVLGAAG